MFQDYKVIIKGGGDLASAVAHKLHRVGFPVIITELAQPKMVRRTVSFGNCIFEKEWTVESVTAVLVENANDIEYSLADGKIPVMVDPLCDIKELLHPFVIIDGILAKKNLGTKINDAPIVIGLGPGFKAGKDVHMVVETKRGHNLGRVIDEGRAEENTGIPGSINGYTAERVLRSHCSGVVKNIKEIGELVEIGDIICHVEEMPVKAKISGVVRGLIHDGIVVKENEKIGDIDPRGIKSHCYTISDKGRNIAGGVLEGLLSTLKARSSKEDKNEEGSC